MQYEERKLFIIAKRTSLPNAEVETFAKPERYVLRPRYLTIQPNTGNVYDSTLVSLKTTPKRVVLHLMSFGKPRLVRVIDFILTIPEGFAIEPDEGWGFDANYVVNRVAKQNVVIYFALKSIVEN